MNTNPLANDLDYILQATLPLWESFRNQRIFLTGGTGFFGCWLLESFVWANQQLALNATMVILTRDPSAFAKKCPHLVNASCLTFHQGDVRSFDFPAGSFSYIIHAATDASAALNQANPLLMLDTVVEGTRHVLEFARHAKVQQILLTSSGAVYGKQPTDVSHLSEGYDRRPDVLDPTAAYAVGKLTAEHLCALYAKQYGLNVKIARCFAFVGPYLPLDIHFAIGNFIRDAMVGDTIQVKGDGTPLRSYLYAADLVIWLLTILIRGKSLHPYNVGSDQAYSIEQIARLVASTYAPEKTVTVMQAPLAGRLPERYVPDVSRAATELQLTAGVSLAKAIQLTQQWYAVRYAQGEKVT